MEILDFRSDTVTRPTQAMYTAMMKAPLGDDVYGDDPTINRLEAEAATITGKEAALFVPSGTFGNQLCIMTHIRPANEIIVGSGAHIVVHECGACAKLSGAMVREIADEAGYMEPAAIEAKIRKEADIHFPETSLICVENAHSNGRIIPMAILKETYELAKKYDLPIHMDGARLFNAAEATGVSVADICQVTDSVTFCLSKGLCAPIGSMVCGTQAFIDKARKNRKLMGGGLRQAGILAACGLVALADMPAQLKVDHANATYLADKLDELPFLKVYRDRTQINMVFLTAEGDKLEQIHGLPEVLSEQGILINPPEDGVLRFVTHHPLDEAACDRLVQGLKDYFES